MRSCYLQLGMEDYALPEIKERENDSDVVAVIPHLHFMAPVLDLHTLQPDFNNTPKQYEPLVLAKHNAHQVQDVVEEESMAKHI